jgi:hypothetical protein
MHEGAYKSGSSTEAIPAAFGNIIQWSDLERPVLGLGRRAKLTLTLGSSDIVHAIPPVVLLEVIEIEFHGTQVLWQYPLPTPRSLKDF